MMCKSMKPSGWFIAAPLFPFLAAAWVGGSVRRRAGWCSQAPAAGRGETTGRRAAARPADDIVDTAAAAGSFGTLVKAVEAAELADTLKGKGPFTVFAPTDDAFDRLPEGALEELLEDKEKLTAVLTLHVVPGRVSAAALDGTASLKTIQGQSLTVDTSMGTKIGTAYVVRSDVETSNGVIHAIDSVLLPE